MNPGIEVMRKGCGTERTMRTMYPHRIPRDGGEDGHHWEHVPSNGVELVGEEGMGIRMCNRVVEPIVLDRSLSVVVLILERRQY
jgi:hypothetical protein